MGMWLLLTSQYCLSCSWQGGIGQTPWLGRRYLAPLVLEKKLGAGRAGPGGGSRAESSSVTQVGQEHFIKVLSLPLASGDLWGAAVRDVATGEVQVSSPSHPASPCGCQAGV